jgi:hypothetical protein
MQRASLNQRQKVSKKNSCFEIAMCVTRAEATMQRPKQCQIVDDWYDLPYGANSSQHARDPRQSPPDALASDVKGEIRLLGCRYQLYHALKYGNRCAVDV